MLKIRIKIVILLLVICTLFEQIGCKIITRKRQAVARTRPKITLADFIFQRLSSRFGKNRARKPRFNARNRLLKHQPRKVRIP